MLFPIKDDIKLKEVEQLKKDKEYNNLRLGLKYFATEIDNDKGVVSEIGKLNKQIENLIDTKFPDLFKDISEY